MEKVNIDATDISPKVILDHLEKVFEMKGESRPENSLKFYGPILNWFDEYNMYLFWVKGNSEGRTLSDLNFKFHFDYINSSSLKCIYDVLKKIESLKANAGPIKITWMFDDGDEEMQENGKEFATMIDLNFEIIQGKRF